MHTVSFVRLPCVVEGDTPGVLLPTGAESLVLEVDGLGWRLIASGDGVLRAQSALGVFTFSRDDERSFEMMLRHVARSRGEAK